MKKTIIAALMLGMVALSACRGSGGSSPLELCTSPANVCAMAYATALNTMISNYAAIVYAFKTAYTDGNNTGTITTQTETYDNIAGLRGNALDTLTLTGGGWSQTVGSSFSVPSGSLVEYTSEMAEYPFITGELAGETITINGTNYTVTATSSTISGDLYGTMTYTGSPFTTLVVTDIPIYSGHGTVDTMAVTVTDPSATVTTGTTSVANQVIGATDHNSAMRMSTVMTVNVTADAKNYECSIAALYDPPTASSFGATGVGTLTVSLSSCSEL